MGWADTMSMQCRTGPGRAEARWIAESSDRKVLQTAVAAAWQGHCYKVMLMTGSTMGTGLASAGFEQKRPAFKFAI